MLFDMCIRLYAAAKHGFVGALAVFVDAGGVYLVEPA